MESITLSSRNDLQQAARQFIEQTKPARVFAFYGEMGAGKTTFIKAICRELGVEENMTSPTFALINEYDRPDG
ncbi:MAG TPA: tRNA (adenosine(37)-N6)-threonylcarbamoyltransferase complex ATPase subunit type 1 TsaE, partial [Prolixibacteraceae bacterium]|nr:tRNA (adenosine(37)-N6)-threonylcarbamoyltransferase complex ATPase subunit type 1 TsaE [Prolixibacteraceae bacterium]